MSSILTAVLINAGNYGIPLNKFAFGDRGEERALIYFVMTVVIAASTSFLTPVGHQVNVLILGAGDYSFFDYTKVGIGLNLIVLLLVVTILPLIWPLY